MYIIAIVGSEANGRSPRKQFVAFGHHATVSN
ncbi:hypothetical protein ABIF70_005164 [Bradyrhizobium japonicum]